jgi:GNAT superfamily N-acetyltransferase
MRIIKSNELTKPQKEAIIYLWNREYPRQLAVTAETFDEFLDFSTGHTHYMIIDDVNEIVGWAFTFDRDGDKWFSIIINSLFQHIGLGRMLLNLIKSNEKRLNGWVIDHPHDVKQNGEPYLSPLKFYLKNGFTVRPDIRYEEEKISSVKIEWRKD